jgi:hypothetical protein
MLSQKYLEKNISEASLNLKNKQSKPGLRLGSGSPGKYYYK